jgi:hypothetical protein
MDVDLDQARRRAKELLSAARAGDRQAREQLRADRLTDAQHAIARELGFASWPALARHAEATRKSRGDGEPATSQLGGGDRAARLDREPAGRGVHAERLAPGDAQDPEARVLEPGPAYAPGRPVRLRLRIRGRRRDLDDLGAAVRAAGAPASWLDIAERVVAAAGLNVNRRGVVFVPAVAGRDLEALARKVADTSLALYQELLERAP